MIVLHIDTEELRTSAALAKQTNDAIQEAASLLQQITVHEDWECRERDNIIKFTLANKRAVLQIEEQSNNFYSAVQTASDRFDQAEQDTCAKHNGIDDIISRVVSVVPGIGGPASGIAGPASGIAGPISDVADISIVDFGAMSSSLEG